MTTASLSGVTVVCWAHKMSDLLARAVQSVESGAPEAKVAVMIHPGSCHDNMKRAMDLAETPWMVWMDHDVTYRPGVLEALLGACQGKTVLACPDENKAFGDIAVRYPDWLPAYFLMLRRLSWKPHIDTKMPGLKGMTDVDICYQARAAGYKVAHVTGVSVGHKKLEKMPQSHFDAGLSPTLELQKSWYPEQFSYMRRKWGDGFSIHGD